MSEKLKIGTVVRAHGLRGLVRIRVDSGVLAELSRVIVGGLERKLERVQPEREDFLVQLEGVVGRDQAEALRGAAVEAYRDELPPPAEGELYVADLIGCRVFDAAGGELGVVAETFPSGAHEVLVVRGGAREFMLPLVDSIVTGVDVKARRVDCDPPPGLIDPDEAEPG